MPENDQASAVLDGWIEAQRRMWDAWTDATRTTTSSAGSSASGDPGDHVGAAESSVADMTAQWRDLVGMALKAWADEALPLAKAVGESVAQGSERAVEMFELSIRAWRSMVPGGAADGDWAGVSGQFVDQLSRLLLHGPLEPMAQSNQMMELWRLSFEEMARLQRSWFEEFVEAPPSANGDGPEPTVLRTFNDRYWDTWERTFGRLLESPNMGHSREVTQKATAAMRAWVRFRRAATEYECVLADALARAWAAFVEEVVGRVERGQPLQTAGEVLKLWGKTADRVLTESFADEPYARAQGQLVNTAMAYRLAEREVVDQFLQMSHIPSRSELDEANKAIYELKRQVRDLQKTVRRMAEATKAQPAPTPPPAPKAARPKPPPKSPRQGGKRTS